MVRWCGSRGACDIDNESGTVKSFHNSTVALPSCLVPYGKKAYFEMEVVSRGKTIQAGWATLALERSGHDEHSMVGMHYGSWGVDGVGQMTHGDGKEGPYDCGWTEGDVVGLAVDLVGNGAIYFSLNGKVGSTRIRYAMPGTDSACSGMSRTGCSSAGTSTASRRASFRSAAAAKVCFL